VTCARIYTRMGEKYFTGARYLRVNLNPQA
jgi:hypothetical protein